MDEGLNKFVDRVLFTKKEIADRVAELGKQITEYYEKDSADLLLVCILKGGVMFMTELMKNVDLDVEIDFMSVASYGANTVSSGDVRIIKDIENPFMGKNLLIVEDIIDTGYTLDYLTKNLKDRGAKSVKIAALLNKEGRRVVDLHGDFVGFDIPDEYVIGYGMDFNQKLRNLPYVATLKARYYK